MRFPPKITFFSLLIRTYKWTFILSLSVLKWVTEKGFEFGVFVASSSGVRKNGLVGRLLPPLLRSARAGLNGRLFLGFPEKKLRPPKLPQRARFSSASHFEEANFQFAWSKSRLEKSTKCNYWKPMAGAAGCMLPACKCLSAAGEIANFWSATTRRISSRTFSDKSLRESIKSHIYEVLPPSRTKTPSAKINYLFPLSPHRILNCRTVVGKNVGLLPDRRKKCNKTI